MPRLAIASARVFGCVLAACVIRAVTSTWYSTEGQIRSSSTIWHGAEASALRPAHCRCSRQCLSGLSSVTLIFAPLGRFPPQRSAVAMQLPSQNQRKRSRSVASRLLLPPAFEVYEVRGSPDNPPHHTRFSKAFDILLGLQLPQRILACVSLAYGHGARQIALPWMTEVWPILLVPLDQGSMRHGRSEESVRPPQRYG